MLSFLIVLGAAPFLLMGAAHGALALRDLARPRAFTPPDPALRDAMRASGVRFHRDINLWRAWMGFNLTHSLGLVVFGGALAYIGVAAPARFAASGLLQGVAVLVAGAYLALSHAFFFSRPVAGSALGLLAFVAAALWTRV